MVKSKCPKALGQGIVEYAGALVIAATIVATSLQLFPNSTAQLFQQITANIVSSVISSLPK